MSEKINEAKSNTAVNIEDQIWFLLGRDLLHLSGVVQHGGGGEVLLGKLTDNHNSLVGVVDALDSVTDAHDQLTLLLHFVHKIKCRYRLWSSHKWEPFVVTETKHI